MGEILVLLLLAASSMQQHARDQAYRTDPPIVLTVCEALCRALEYEGRYVYIVGRVRFTDEGIWLSQDQCPCTLMWSREVLGSSISLEYHPELGPKGDYDLIRTRAIQKLKEVEKTTSFQEEECGVVIFGEFRSIWGQEYQTKFERRRRERIQSGIPEVRPGFGHLNGSPAGLFGPCDISSLTPGVEFHRLE